MSGVMDIKHLLCQPCEPYSSKPSYFEPGIHPPFSTYPELESLNSSCQSSICSSPRTLSPPQTPPSSFRRRVQSEVYVNQLNFILHPSPSHNRRRSTSTSYIQTRTPWTPQEDCLLQQGYEQGLSWAMISATYLPHRSRGCCWGRFKTLQNKNIIEVKNQRICRRPWKVTYKKVN